MQRKARIDAPEALHHIILRGIKRRNRPVTTAIRPTDRYHRATDHTTKGEEMNHKYKELFSPLTIRNITLKNRIEASPISLFDLACTPEKHPSKDGEGFYRIRAMGGAAIVTIGDGIVHPTGIDSGYLPSPKIMICNDDNIPFITAISEEIQRYGAIACMQLNHAGMLSTSADFSGWGPDFIDFSENLMPSALSDQNSEGQVDSRHGIVKYMTEEMIEEITEAFGTSALRAKRCGFDMVQVHAAHGWLLHQFLSPLTNHRTDRFGGSLENRARFFCLVLDRIRQYCGEEFLIEVRLSGTEYVEGGFTIDDMVEVAKMIDDKVDLMHVSAGNFAYPETECLMIPTMFTENGHNTYLAAEIKRHVKSRVSTIGGITDLNMMEELIAGNKADMVALGRALLADPQLPNKARRGQEEEICPCIRCSNCIGNYQMRVLRCAVNPVIHRPWEVLTPQIPAVPKKVLIIGGGPAGMEAAVIAKERGHEVLLCDKSDILGGLIRYSRKIIFKKDTERYLDFMIAKVNRTGVDIRLNTEVTPELVEKIKPDHLIVAIGAQPVVPPIKGIKNAHFIMDVYDCSPAMKERIAIVGGGLSGCEAAVEYALMGKEVVLVHMESELAKDSNPIHRTALLGELSRYSSLITIYTDTTCTEISNNEIVCINSDGKEETISAGSVIIAAGLKSTADRVNEFRDICNEFDYIGDCKKPRQIRQAVLEGYNAAMNI